MSAVVDLDQSKAELEAVIASGIFAKAPSLALLLDYVCSKYFEGLANQIKEYNIAVEALGRPTSFDPRQDSIVRVEAFRLRKRLKQYYENEGAGHLLRIIIPPGQYVPQFVENCPSTNGHPIDASNGNEPEHQVALLPSSNHELTLAGAQLTPTVLIPEQHPFWIRIAAFVGLPLLVAAALLVVWSRPLHPLPKATSATRVTSTPIGAESDEVRILSGSSAARYVDRTGNIWSADRFFHGGSVFTTPSHLIVGTTDLELFRSRREGDFSYDVPLKPGIYELHLYFTETLFGENNTAGGGESSRVFRIWVNDKPILPEFDVLADAGGSNMADERVFKDVSPAADGLLHVRFGSLTNGTPFVNALEILPGIPGKMRPVRILVRTRNHTDQRGLLWGADRYFSHGFSVARSEPVSNTTDPEMYTAERFGNFVYTIPAADGRYAVTLKFAETWFGPGQPGAGGMGSRLFDVFCNGTALVRNFDIFRAAGGAQRAIEKTFHGISPNAQGKIFLSFVPVVNYACVNAIEVLDESN